MTASSCAMYTRNSKRFHKPFKPKLILLLYSLNYLWGIKHKNLDIYRRGIIILYQDLFFSFFFSVKKKRAILNSIGLSKDLIDQFI